MKRKVIYILHDLKPGGVEVALLSALEDLNKEFDFRLIVLGFIDFDFIKHLDEGVKDKIEIFPYKTVLFPFYFFKSIIYVLRFKPDVLISSLWRANLIGSLSKLLRKRIRFITFIHSTKFFHFFDKIISLIALRIADKVFVDSIASKNRIMKIRRNLDCEIISFVICSNETNLKLSRIEKKARFLFIGRINWVKNIPLAVRFVKELRSLGVDLEFDVYGPDDGDLRNVIHEIEKQDAHLYVHLKGVLDTQDKYALFFNYHFYIQFSHFEGMAMSVVEAMQYGLVCIVNPVGEIPSYTRDMKSAIYVNTELGSFSIEDLYRVKNVVDDPKLFNYISKSGASSVKNKIKYKDSLVSEIYKVLTLN